MDAVARRETVIIFPGYTADQIDLLLSYLAKFRGCRLVLDVADITYLQYKYFIGEPSQKSAYDFARLVEIADVLLFATPSMMHTTQQILDISDKESHVVENATDPNHFRCTASPKENVIFYVGAYGEVRGVDELLEAFRILRGRRIDCSLKLVSVGFPTEFSEPGVEVWRSLFYNEIPSIFESCSVFVIPHRRNLYMRMAAPLKLFDAMASGRPVVSTNCDETVSVIKREDCGIVAEEDPKSIADSIAALFEDKKAAREKGMNGRTAVEQRYSWKLRAQQIHEILIRGDSI